MFLPSRQCWRFEWRPGRLQCVGCRSFSQTVESIFTKNKTISLYHWAINDVLILCAVVKDWPWLCRGRGLFRRIWSPHVRPFCTVLDRQIDRHLSDLYSDLCGNCAIPIRACQYWRTFASLWLSLQRWRADVSSIFHSRLDWIKTNFSFKIEESIKSYRKVATVEGVNDERFVANVDNSADSAARTERGNGSGIILDRSVIVAVFDFLFFPPATNKQTRKKKNDPSIQWTTTGPSIK